MTGTTSSRRVIYDAMTTATSSTSYPSYPSYTSSSSSSSGSSMFRSLRPRPSSSLRNALCGHGRLCTCSVCVCVCVCKAPLIPSSLPPTTHRLPLRHLLISISIERKKKEKQRDSPARVAFEENSGGSYRTTANQKKNKQKTKDERPLTRTGRIGARRPASRAVLAAVLGRAQAEIVAGRVETRRAVAARVRVAQVGVRLS